MSSNHLFNAKPSTSSASASSPNDSRLFKCTTCSNLFNFDARAPLYQQPCLHLKCEICLTSTPSCSVPDCEVKISTPSSAQSHDAIVCHIAMSKVISSTPSAPKNCDMCDEDEMIEATVTCLSCADGFKFCDRCFKKHLKQQKEHKSAPLGTFVVKSLKCKTHPSNDVSHVCKKDRVYLCFECIPTSPHQQHGIIDVKDDATVKKILADTKATIDIFKESISKQQAILLSLQTPFDDLTYLVQDHHYAHSNVLSDQLDAYLCNLSSSGQVSKLQTLLGSVGSRSSVAGTPTASTTTPSTTTTTASYVF